MRSAKATDYDKLVVELYRGIESQRPFRTFLIELAHAVGADAATIIIERKTPDRPGAIFSGGAPPRRRQAYDAFFDLDPFKSLPVGRALTIAEHIGPDGVRNSPFMRDFMIPNGLYHVLGMDLIVSCETRIRLRATRLTGESNFATPEKALFESLGIHLRQAVDLFLSIESAKAEREVFTCALNRLSLGALVVDKDARVLLITKKAEEIIQRKGILICADGKLRMTANASKRDELKDAIACMADPDALPHMMRAISLQLEDGTALNLVIRPAAVVSRLEAPIEGSALVVMADATWAVAPSAQTLSQLLRLTPAEAELAVLLGQGFDLEDASLMLGITKNTAKAHLRVIFSKTNVKRQSGLVRLILRSVDELS